MGVLLAVLRAAHAGVTILAYLVVALMLALMLRVTRPW